MNRHNNTQFAVFIICTFSLFLKDLFFQIIQRSQQLLLCHVELVNFSPYIDIVLAFFHILVLQEYWVWMESRIQLKLVLGGISSYKQTQ